MLAEDADETERLMRLMAELDDVLRRERAAICKLDSAGVEALTSHKQELAEQLALLLTPAPGTSIVARSTSPEQELIRKQLRRQTVRLLASAEANRALLEDAIDSIASARGLRPATSGAYDSRARVTQRVRTVGAKRI